MENNGNTKTGCNIQARNNIQGDWEQQIIKTDHNIQASREAKFGNTVEEIARNHNMPHGLIFDRMMMICVQHSKGLGPKVSFLLTLLNIHQTERDTNSCHDKESENFGSHHFTIQGIFLSL
jgi:hypothetical protein